LISLFLNDSIVNHSASEFSLFLSFFLSFFYKKRGKLERYVERRVRTGLVMHRIQRHPAGAAEKRIWHRRCRSNLFQSISSSSSDSLTSQSQLHKVYIYATHLTFSGGNIIIQTWPCLYLHIPIRPQQSCYVIALLSCRWQEQHNIAR
jgi:hypothetical protein